MVIPFSLYLCKHCLPICPPHHKHLSNEAFSLVATIAHTLHPTFTYLIHNTKQWLQESSKKITSSAKIVSSALVRPTPAPPSLLQTVAFCLVVSSANFLIEDARQTLTQEFHTLGSSVDLELRDRITTIHSNASALESQSKTLRNRTNALSKTTRQWGGLADGARTRLKV